MSDDLPPPEQAAATAENVSAVNEAALEPVGKPIDPPIKRTPSASTLRAYLPLYFRKTDAAISHLQRVLATPGGIDTFLLTVCYTSLSASTVLSRLKPTPRLSTSLRALSDLISDFRIFVRLWGLLSMYSWAKGTLQSPPKSKAIKRIVWAQIVVNVLYQVLENGAYLASKGVLSWDKEKQSHAWIWSSRFWAAHVGLEFGKLWVVKKNAAASALKQVEKKDEGVVEKFDDLNWRRELLVNVAWAPLTVHWSLEQGAVSDFWVGVLGSVAGAVGLSELWKSTSA